MFSELLQRVSSQVSGRVPSQCAACHAWPSQPVCEACVNQFAQPKLRCHTCGLRLAAGVVDDVTQCGMCLRNPPQLDRCLAAVSYEYPWGDLIVQYKFGAQTGWSDTFALLLAQRAQGGARAGRRRYRDSHAAGPQAPGRNGASIRRWSWPKHWPRPKPAHGCCCACRTGPCKARCRAITGCAM